MNIKDINLEEYEILEQIDKETIILKKKKPEYPKWEDLKKITGYYIKAGSNISELNEFNIHDAIHFNKNVFLTKKHAKSALAMAQISQLISYYGGEITDEEWMDNSMRKYALLRNNNKIKLVDGCLMVYSFLVFHTEEQRDEFLKNNEQLVKDYLMIE